MSVLQTANTLDDVCYCVIPDLADEYTAVDNSGVKPNVIIQALDSSGEMLPVDGDFKFKIGKTRVVATATDVSGAKPCATDAVDGTIGPNGCDRDGSLTTD
eukprot:SAG31_NODE_28755_length_405_cov_1.176471_1_plen_100_part_01